MVEKRKEELSAEDFEKTFGIPKEVVEPKEEKKPKAPPPKKKEEEKESEWYLKRLKAQKEWAKRTNNEELLDNVRAQVEAELRQKADPALIELEVSKQELTYFERELEQLSEGIKNLEEAGGYAEEIKTLEADKEKAEKEKARLEKEITAKNKEIAPFSEPLIKYQGREEEILEEHPGLFLKPEDERAMEIEVRRLPDGGVEVMAPEEAELRGIRPTRYEFRIIDEAYAELKKFLNMEVRKYGEIRAVEDYVGSLIIGSIREFAELAYEGYEMVIEKVIEDGKEIEKVIKREITTAERKKEIYKIHSDAIWEYDTIKRIMDYWILACDTKEGMGVGFGNAVHYGRRMGGKHLKWLWNSYRGEGVKRAMGEKAPRLDPAEYKAEFMKYVEDKELGKEGYGGPEDADVNKMLGTMLRLGAGMGVYDGAEKARLPFKLRGQDIILEVEWDPDLPVFGSVAMTEKMSGFMYEVMKNTVSYYFRYPESRLELLGFFFEPTGRFTEEGKPIYRCWLSDQLLNFVTAYQMEGLEEFYFDNIRGFKKDKEGKVIEYRDDGTGPLGKKKKRLEELGWDDKKNAEDNLKALAMFREDELLANAEGRGWKIVRKNEEGKWVDTWEDGTPIWDRTKRKIENLEALRALPIDKLIQLPGAYWLIRKHLGSLRVWEIDDWQEFEMDKYPDGHPYCSWAMRMNYHQATRNTNISFLRGEHHQAGLLGWIDELETKYMMQIPNHLAFKKENFLDFIRDNISRASVLPTLWESRMKGAGFEFTLRLREALARRMVLPGWRKKVKLRGCGFPEASPRIPSAWPDKLLGRMLLQFMSEETPVKYFLHQNGIEYLDFVHWCGLEIKEKHEDDVSFDGDRFTWNEFRLATEEEKAKWERHLRRVAPKIIRMIDVIPGKVNWDRQDPAFEYKLAKKIAREYVRKQIEISLKRGGWRGWVLSYFYTFGAPTHSYEERIRTQRILRRQKCGLDGRKEEDRVPLIDGERPFGDILVGRYWVSQRIALKEDPKEKLPDGRPAMRWCRPEETVHTPYIYRDVEFNSLVGLEMDLLPSNEELARMRSELSPAQQRERLKSEAEKKSGVTLNEETLDLLEQLADVVLERDPMIARKKARQITYQEAERKVGLDSVLDLVYCTMEGCPLSREELSNREAWYDAEGWWLREITRRYGQMTYQYAQNEVDLRNAKQEERVWTPQEYCEETNEIVKIYNPLTIFLALDTAANLQWIDRNEYAALCQLFHVNARIAANYHNKIKALGFEDPITRELLVKTEGEVGKAFAQSVATLLGAGKGLPFRLKLMGGKTVNEFKRGLRNVLLPTVLEWAAAYTYWGLGGSDPELAYTIGTFLVAVGADSYARAGTHALGWRRWLSRLIGMECDRQQSSHIENLARGYVRPSLSSAVVWLLPPMWITWLWGCNPIDLTCHPSNIDPTATVRAFGEYKAKMGGGLPT